MLSTRSCSGTFTDFTFLLFTFLSSTSSILIICVFRLCTRLMSPSSLSAASSRKMFLKYQQLHLHLHHHLLHSIVGHVHFLCLLHYGITHAFVLRNSWPFERSPRASLLYEYSCLFPFLISQTQLPFVFHMLAPHQTPPHHLLHFYSRKLKPLALLSFILKFFCMTLHFPL